eukprot:141120-Rhodomonas_salina.2
MEMPHPQQNEVNWMSFQSSQRPPINSVHQGTVHGSGFGRQTSTASLAFLNPAPSPSRQSWRDAAGSTHTTAP